MTELSFQEQIEIALDIAMKAHRGQRDLDGNPVILHPLAVALKGRNPQEIIVGLLHDVVEDTDYTFDDLLAAGISSHLVDSLRRLTHNKDVDYFDYVRGIASSGDFTAINVKCHDLENNLERGRAGDHFRQVAKHTAASKLIHPVDEEDAAWDSLMDDPDEAPFWRAKFDFWKHHMPIEEATAAHGVTIDQYMQFFHPDNNPSEGR